MANFNHAVAQATSGGTPSASYMSLAQIEDHLYDSTGGSASLLQGQMIRYLEIGGIVWNWHVFLNDEPLATVSAHALAWHALVVDRLGNTGDPTSIPDFSVNQVPITSASAVSALGQETLWPMRVLYREQRVFAIGIGDTGQQAQISNERPRSKRLRLRLDDVHGLFFYFSTLQSVEETVNFTHVVSGSLYYRVIYGR